MKRKLLSRAVAISTLLSAATPLIAQDSEIEEIVVLGTLREAADNVLVERQQSEIVADFIDVSTIARVGDTNVAAALRRVPGVTLVDNKFVFVRGLGERYSNSLLNKAQIPSPDLTRNVLPLDIFPTSILKSIAVHKGYAPDMPASFSGGLIDIRTQSIPDELVFSAEISANVNSESTGDVLSYEGGGDDWLGTDDGTRALPEELQRAVDYYNGSLDSITILERINLNGATNTLQDAQQINRRLALLLNRDIDITEDSENKNGRFQINLGNNFYFDNGMELGFISGATYGNTTRSNETEDRSFGDPENIFSNRETSVRNVSLTGSFGLGLRWYDDHSIETSSLLIRNTDDEAFIRDYYTSSFLFSDTIGFRDYGTRFEERELKVNQIRGTHSLGGTTRDLISFESLGWLDDLSVEWFYSDATSVTSIPGETTLTYRTNVDVTNGDVLAQRLQASATAGDFRFTDLEDEVLNYGWDAKLPVYLDDMDVELSGGYNYARKSRSYKQIQFGLGTSDTNIADSLTGLTSSVFSDSVIRDPANVMSLDLNGSNGESYLAAIINTSAYGKVNLTWRDTWRVMMGARWEDFSQAGLPWDPLEYSGCQISCDPDVLVESVFKNDDFYPSVALTYMKPDFWAAEFQLRFGYSETLIRPDLREITPSSYIDPITSARVTGNADVVPASVKNYDIRGEWFFDSGDSLTLSLFYKDIIDPIDLFQSAAFEEALATEILNGESAEVYGVEAEWLKDLSFIGNKFEGFFVGGNLTLLESELTAGADADAPTNPKRALAGASDTSFNVQLGYDSYDGIHSAMLIYNVFSERLYFAGRNATPDAFEQPFHSLDLTYFYYPTDNWVVKLKAQNILDEEVSIEQEGVTTFVAKPGSTFSLGVQWRY